MANIAIPHGIPAVILGALSVPNATATISSLGIAAEVRREFETFTPLSRYDETRMTRPRG